MNLMKKVLYALVAVLVALLAGYLWGHAGFSGAERSLAAADRQLDLSKARADILAARVDLFEVNFGRAGQHLQAAEGALNDAAGKMTAARGDDRRVAQVKDLATRVTRAQDLAARLDQSANTRLAEVLAMLEQVMSEPEGGR